jgi:hypothetical protein
MLVLPKFRQKKNANRNHSFLVLQQALELERHVAGIDVFRMDSGGLKNYILDLLSIDTIQKLKGFNDTTANLEIIKALLRAAHPLPKIFMEEVLNRLRLLATGDNQALHLIEKQQTHSSQKHKYQQYSIIVIIVITIILCSLIHFASR